MNMKRIKPFIPLWVIILMAMTACTHENNEQIQQKNEIKLKSQISTSSARGTNLNQQSTQIVEGQKVGITITGAQNEHNNVVWTVGEEGRMTSNQPVYWNNAEASITAYHPYNYDWTGTEHTFTVSNRQDTDTGYLNSDLLWTSTKSKPTDTPVALTFEHKLAKINVKLTSSVYSSLSNATINICGTKTSVDFNPVTGELGSISHVADIVAAVTTVDTYTATAIIVPQTINSGTPFIEIILDNKTYQFQMPSTKTFKSGHSYTYNLELKKNSVNIDSDGIIDWEDEIVSPEDNDNSKKLVGMTIERSYGTGICTFTYDENNRLVSWGGTQISSKDEASNTYNYALEWKGNKCTETCDVDEDIVLYYTFSDNMMQTSTWGNWTQTFVYNSDKQLIRIDHSYSDDDETSYETFHWEYGKLITINDSRGGSINLTYNDITCKGFNPAIFLFDNLVIEDVNLVISNPELLGLRTNNLVSKITEEYDGAINSISNFSYTLDSNGYIDSCRIIEEDGDTETYTFVWE